MQEMKLLTTGTLSYWMTFCGGSWIFYVAAVRSSGSGRGLNPKCGPMISSTTPNQSPREAGYANNGFSEISAVLPREPAAELGRSTLGSEPDARTIRGTISSCPHVRTAGSTSLCRTDPLSLAPRWPRIADCFGGPDQAPPDCDGVAPERFQCPVLVVPVFLAR